MTRSAGVLLAALVLGCGYAAAEPSEEEKVKQEQVKAILADFEKAYKVKEESARETAVEGLVSAPPDKKIVDRLTKIIAGPEADKVKLAAIRVLGRFTGDRNASQALVKVLPGFKKSPEITEAILAAMGDVGDPSVAPILIDLYRDKTLLVAKAAVEASSRIKDKALIEPLIKLLKEFDQGDVSPAGLNVGPDAMADERSKRKMELESPAKSALEAITGQTFSTAKEWDGWWRKNKGSFKIEKKV